MSRKLSVLIIALLFHLLLFSTSSRCGNARGATVDGPAEHDSLDGYKVLFGYANDDFLLETQINRLLGTRFFPARDDHVSGSFFLSALFYQSRTAYRADIVYHVLTDRATLFRADLLALGVTLEKGDRPVRYELGLGAHLLGNLGGEFAQNGYHRIFGYKKVGFNYDGSLRGGIRCSGRAEYQLPPLSEQAQVLPFTSIMFSTGFLLNSVSFGVSGNARLGILQFDGAIEYVSRYEISPPLESILGSGTYYGILGETSLAARWSIAAWITKGQFGLDNEYHFGLNVGWAMGTVRPTRLKDIAFP